jgi:hypothetical protein
MGKFSWDNRDPLEGIERDPRNPWAMRLAFIVAVIVGALIAKYLSG